MFLWVTLRKKGGCPYHLYSPVLHLEPLEPAAPQTPVPNTLGRPWGGLAFPTFLPPLEDSVVPWPCSRAWVSDGGWQWRKAGMEETPRARRQPAWSPGLSGSGHVDLAQPISLFPKS